MPIELKHQNIFYLEILFYSNIIRNYFFSKGSFHYKCLFPSCVNNQEKKLSTKEGIGGSKTHRRELERP